MKNSKRTFRHAPGAQSGVRDERLVDFGFARVAASDKPAKVAAVFESVATRYDLMNDVSPI